MFGLPTEFKLIVGAIGIVALLALGLFAYHTIEAKGEAKIVAILQPKLDAANAKIGALDAANNINVKTIAELQANEVANDALIANYAASVTALNQQSDDAAAMIRKLQNDDPTVDAYLRTPIPAALRLRGQPASEPAAGADGKDGHAAASKAGGVPAIAK